MKKCAACGLRRDKNITMHRLPRNEEIRNLWFKAINIELSSSALICSNHFKESDYNSQILPRKILKSNVVPSQFVRNNNVHNLFPSKYSNNMNNDFSNSSNINIKSEEELCYVYYLDESQNVYSFESLIRYDCFENTCSDSSNYSNKIVSLLNSEVGLESSSSKLNFAVTQSTNDSCTEDKSLKDNNAVCISEFQNQSVEIRKNLTSSDFTTKHAWEIFCNITSEYRGQIYELKHYNSILLLEMNHLKNELSIHNNNNSIIIDISN